MKSNTFKKLNGKGLKIAIVQARFNNEITDALAQGAVKALMESGVADKDIKIFQVPGAFEIPLACQRLARPPAGGKKFDGVITIGAIIKGETAHDVYLANTATDGIMRVMLDYNFPIAFGVITTYNLTQAKARARDDKNNKGYEAAMALIEILSRSA
ncbi:6,7-dimethyl-8-ribityllumazine synthase [Patescibacteria group bacterium]|nr:6,7-dimethyl-8-ribityllumazine synthase [Patescibacteria group bacterium]MBU4600993.1 6,7-dimethyl-8-ribityllumazine synthase [Patescibacteria group bacterium]MCG2697767.1 6,7-dimethyl-8-ribityllumazine synthase [Candidatus Parcubacteria bacterium]